MAIWLCGGSVDILTDTHDPTYPSPPARRASNEPKTTPQPFTGQGVKGVGLVFIS
ncbi:MAG: hypothetical protein BroJett018_53050 [Chloroflexota bacterium]|nr:MAG: hypothetical protein BroJett018_53050 [Chloroflexota bacterium]